MIRFIIVLFISIIPIPAIAQSGIVDSVHNNILETNLKNEILLEVQEKLYEQYSNTVSATNEISNKGLTYQTIILAIFWIILTIGGLYLWWLVNSRLSSIEKIRNAVDKIWNEINNTPELFFQKLRNIELDYIIERLENFDIRDIQHFNAILNTRVIAYKYADRFIDIYRNPNNSSHQIQLLQLILLHFPDKVYLDNDLWRDFIGHFYSLYPLYYKKEVEIIIEKLVVAYLNNPDSRDRLGLLNEKINWISDVESKELWAGLIKSHLEKNNLTN